MALAATFSVASSLACVSASCVSKFVFSVSAAANSAFAVNSASLVATFSFSAFISAAAVPVPTFLSLDLLSSNACAVGLSPDGITVLLLATGATNAGASGTVEAAGTACLSVPYSSIRALRNAIAAA